MDVDAKRVSELPVFQRHNGWEVVKDDLHYVVRNPHTKEEVYRGNTLKRAKEVAKEGDPPLE